MREYTNGVGKTVEGNQFHCLRFLFKVKVMSQEKSKLPIELRQVARDLENTARASYCYSNIHSIVQNAIDHICAVARTIELREELEAKDVGTTSREQGAE